MEAVQRVVEKLDNFFLPFHVNKLNESQRTDPLRETVLGNLPLPAGVPDYVQMAIPLMLSMVVIEFIFVQVTQRLRGKKATLKVNDEHPWFRVNDSINSLSLGTVQQILFQFVKPITVLPYTYLWHHYRVLDIPDTWAGWVVCFVGIDFWYYWFHRTAHEWNWSWAAHSVHHSSENFNLTTALRQASFQSWMSWMYYLPMALLGSSPRLMVAHVQWNMLFQFWIHTETVGKLGWLEYIINTPSQHRVHHGRNPYCIDKNYAGTLSCWDRMFGTFEEERDSEAVKYGLVHAPPNWDPIWANFEHFLTMWRRVKKQKFFKKIPVLWHGPGWNPNGPDYIAPNTDDQPAIRYDPPLSLHVKIYTMLHFALHTFSSVVFLAKKKSLPTTSAVLWAMADIYAFHSLSCVLSRTRRAALKEGFRLAFVAVALAAALDYFVFLSPLATAVDEVQREGPIWLWLCALGNGLVDWGVHYPEPVAKFVLGFVIVSGALIFAAGFDKPIVKLPATAAAAAAAAKPANGAQNGAAGHGKKLN